ncbi:acyltransferase [Massilia putida]|uniref:acyltransferase n=1 Tax=Massilia putida TaxID=1141883 RepID=UPI0027D81709|nr:acyltransferase [Massilia putida]
MIGLVRKVWRKLFYDPYKVVRRNPHITMGASYLGKSFSVEFLVPRKRTGFIAGNDCIMYCQAFFESEQGAIEIGDRVYIGGGTQLISRSGIKIGNDVMISWGCTVYDHDAHSIDYRSRMEDHAGHLRSWSSGNLLNGKNWSTVKTAPIVIEDHVWLGFDVVVLKGVTIGEGAVVAARSVVTSDVPPWTVVAGSPARVVRQIPADMQKPRRDPTAHGVPATEEE